MKRAQTNQLVGTVLLLGMLLPISACATLFASKSTVIPMSSNPDGADV